jgi:hypothetical protein
MVRKQSVYWLLKQSGFSSLHCTPISHADKQEKLARCRRRTSGCVHISRYVCSCITRCSADDQVHSPEPCPSSSSNNSNQATLANPLLHQQAYQSINPLLRLSHPTPLLHPKGINSPSKMVILHIHHHRPGSPSLMARHHLGTGNISSRVHLLHPQYAWVSMDSSKVRRGRCR